MKALLPAIAAAGLALATMGCGTPPEVNEGADFKTVPPHGWAYGEAFEFEPTPTPDSAGVEARVAVAVRHTDAYVYGNLWLEVTTPLPGSDSVKVDTVNITLADVYGKWQGRGVGVSYVAVDTIPGRRYCEPGRPAKVRHIMRVDTLADIEQVGLIYFDIK